MNRVIEFLLLGLGFLALEQKASIIPGASNIYCYFDVETKAKIEE